MTFLDMMKETDSFTYTENGARAYSSTGNYVLDAFGSLGGMMNSNPTDIINTFMRAFNKDRKLAMRMLFYFRDPRGGQGMRRLFRILVRYLANNEAEYIIRNMDNILFYGRGDDYLCLIGTRCEAAMYDFIRQQLNRDLAAMNHNEECSLLAKWLPSENASSAETVYYAKHIQNGIGMTPRNYRKLLSRLRNYINIVESKMSANKWHDINYSTVPSKASMKYINAFMKHDQNGYIDYLRDVADGNSKINASVLFPVDIVGKVMDNHRPDMKDRILYDCMWNALPNYFTKEETGLCVVDTSGSMHGLPIQVAISLGLYCADKAKGPFAGHFITFSANPKLQEVMGKDIFDKVRNLERADWDMNTNLEKVFKLILDTAIRNHCTPDQIPQKLYIISDMQFDAATSNAGYYNRYGKSETKSPASFMKQMKQRFEDNGYIFPAIVYWNVRASHCGMFQQRVGEFDFCNVSGYSASLFKSVIEGTEYVEEVNEVGNKVVKQKIDPIHVMLTTLMNERYDKVWGG